MSSFLSQLHSRHAVKSFDPHRPLEKNILEKILEAIRMAPSSFGLQPYHIHVVEKLDIKQKLREAGFQQEQFEEAASILVFSTRNDILERIDNYITIASQNSEEKKESLSAYADSMRRSFKGKSEEELRIWAARQAYIALGFAMAACAELQVASCPMEGFIPARFNEILNLSPQFKTVVALAIGYEREPSKHPKVRFSQEDLFEML